MQTTRKNLCVALMAILVTAAVIMAFGARAEARGEDHYLGEIGVFTYQFCPVDWLPTDGRELLIGSNPALFALLGTTYGGNGTTTFAVPKLDCGPLRCCIAEKGIFPSRPN